MNNTHYNYMNRYIFNLQSKGQYTFSFKHVKKTFPDYSEESLRRSISRNLEKRRIIRIWEKFYLIIPPEYSSKGILPPDLFVDDLMDYLEKPYYVGLLSAAAKHGAAHQQPQSFQVITKKPTIRPLNIKNIKINFHFRNEFWDAGLIKMKTDTGYLNVSNPSRTFIDLIIFKRQIGGLKRAIEVIDELLEETDVESFENVLFNYKISNADIQRIGYIVDAFAQKEDRYNNYIDILNNKISSIKYFKTFLDPTIKGHKSSDFLINEKWKIIDNINLKEEV